ncbi:arginyl-tRNA synthetase [Mariprofundus ferrinatatus]|uniref:Arginine--tRNA ligase n=1 Tax=Mariprofundus ferrinatatus TaxID=1921087 RepID=A0A2K8L1L5_9PROT|nr:arginine--tRNA ligase [Mariprofundus ferrinatatus]ATX81177.1 arginyl-tRNA synthetase [Mariprofundus ferrinatatus]
MKQALEQALQQALQQLLKDIEGAEMPDVQLTRPKMKEHGDYAANVAMPLARLLKRSPQQIAASILELVQWPDAVEGADIAGPGFINIRLKKASEAGILKTILSAGDNYGRVELDEHSEKVNLEFVSANPTGPMHVGHARGAVVGDVLGRLLAVCGRDVHREYYINDAGAQIGVLAESVWLRMRELQGETVEFPESAYPGDYVIDIARGLLEKFEYRELATMDADKRLQMIGMDAVAANMDMIRDDLAALNISFDLYFSESNLHQSGRVLELIEKLKADGIVYPGTLPPPKGKEVEDYTPVEQLLFRTTDFGDDVDRPLAKQDGTPTYFAADIAYHVDKFKRGYGRMIDVWGADHGGYVTRVQAAMKALTGLEAQPDVLLVQMVNLTRDGKPVRMSKRAGTFVTLREVVDEVGADAVRFNFMTRRVESQLDFDLEVAKKKNDENPVYYVQYAYARICAILRKAEEEGVTVPAVEEVDLSLLTSHEEQRLISHMLGYPDLLMKAADKLEAYRVATYTMRLAADFHSFYHKHRVVTEDAELTAARLLLARGVAQVIRNALAVLGVSAPERM